MQKKDRKCGFETRISPVICCKAYFSCALAILFHVFCIFYVFILYLLYLWFVFIFRVMYNFRFVSLYHICRSGIEQYLNLTWWIYWCFIFFVQKMTEWFACTDDILTSLVLKKKKKEWFRIDTHLWKLVGFENFLPPPQWYVKISQCIQRMISRGRIHLLFLHKMWELSHSEYFEVMTWKYSLSHSGEIKCHVNRRLCPPSTHPTGVLKIEKKSLESSEGNDPPNDGSGW